MSRIPIRRDITFSRGSLGATDSAVTGHLPTGGPITVTTHCEADRDTRRVARDQWLRGTIATTGDTAVVPGDTLDDSVAAEALRCWLLASR